MLSQRSLLRQINLLVLLAASLAGFSQNWQGMGSGFNRFVDGFYVDSIDSQFYVYGAFDSIANGTPCYETAMWTGTDWDTIPFLTGYYAARQLYNWNGDLLFGANPVMKWNEIQLDTFAVCDGIVLGFVEYGGKLIAYGRFRNINGVPASNIAVFDGISWAPLDTVQWSNGSGIGSAIAYKGNLYFGGNHIGTGPNGQMKALCRWDGSQFWPVGNNELFCGLGGVWNMCEYQGDLFIGGTFNKVYGNPFDGIARWDGTQWKDPMGGIDPPSSNVKDMLVFNNELYICGNFFSVAGMPTNGFAKWDGSQWCIPGLQGTDMAGTSVIVLGGMAVFNGELVIGGNVRTIDGDTVNHVAKWIGGNYTDTCGIQVSVDEEMSLEQIRIYPNPTSGLVTIANLPPAAEVAISIHNLQGQVVFSLSASAAHDPGIHVDLSLIPEGIYFLQIQAGDQIRTTKLIIQR